MAKPQRDDFASKDAFLEKFRYVLARHGAQAAEARDHLALANEVQDWWPEAEQMYKDRVALEKLFQSATGLGASGTGSPAPASGSPWWAVIGPNLLRMLRTLVASGRTQGILLGVAAAVVGWLGLQGLSLTTLSPTIASMKKDIETVREKVNEIHVLTSEIKREVTK